ncbi:CMP-N-acetylneuraminate-beta-galactosamide-alpha-2,3-sialyltransferase 2-like [Serinus canaria]|uniref:CMP-N-acetylneuraminate-beta-galactosamide- alpha-2,3-sialyltransferase 2-like n=1 Tax=Serinus canaria TaxID=9135 RepID=UPI0021CCDD3F|nr:CMP-N-acetylneuraminate-beta-galactosamide-alpha-2,3-sialyltransferase 2-like [Serinus canaria]
MQEDFRSPTTSAFISHVDHCKATDNSLEKKSRALTDGIGSVFWVPSLLHTPTGHCTAPTNSSAWFNTCYKAAIRSLLTGAHHELSSDVVQWWLTLQGPLNGIQLQAIIQQLFNVLWALTADVWDPSHFGTCAVVGNSGQLKESIHGLLTDAYDWVLTGDLLSLPGGTKTLGKCSFVLGQAILSFTMNRSKITGFELVAAMRTTHLFMCCMCIQKSAVNPRPDVHLILIPFKPLDLQWVTSVFSTGELMRYVTTGGWCLLCCTEVSMFGFGSDSEGNWHHYWEKNCWSGAFHKMRTHDTDIEFSLIERRVHEGRSVFYK